MDIATFEQIATILSKLTVSYGNLFTEYYNLFYNPTPMDVTIQYYDEEGNLNTIEIPNRAKDRRFILNGRGEPEGSVSGSKGSLYQDTLNGEIYLKQLGDSISGWSKIISSAELETFIKQGVGSPEGVFTEPKGVLYVDKQNASLYIKSTATGSEGWLLISANTNDLALKDLSNLSEVGEDHFANPSLSNLNTRGRSLIDSKENVANKVTILTEDCTDEQYPSAKLLYDTVTEAKVPMANRDLSNLTAVGEEHFLGKSQLGDGILYAPNGVASVNGNIINVPSGTTYLLSYGRKADGTLNYLRHVSANRFLQVTGANYKGLAFYTSGNSVLTVKDSLYFEQEAQPVAPQEQVALWYNIKTNEHKVKSAGSTEWITTPITKIGQFEVNDGGNITSFTPIYPVRVATEDEIIELKERAITLEGELTTAHAVVKTFNDGSTTYRVYDDGFCIQTGFITFGSTTQNLTFPIPFRDTNYVITMTDCGIDRASFGASKTSNSYVTCYAQKVGNGAYWIAMGYTNEV